MSSLQKVNFVPMHRPMPSIGLLEFVLAFALVMAATWWAGSIENFHQTMEHLQNFTIAGQ